MRISLIEKFLPVSFGPIQISLNFLGRATTPESKTVLSRFRLLLKAHDVSLPLMLQLVPKHWNWTLGSVDGDEFRNLLGPEQFEWFARTFNVRREWLEGAAVSDHYSVAMPLRGYKSLDLLGEDLKSLGWLDDKLCMSILACSYSQDGTSLGRYLILFSHPFADNESERVYSHSLFNSVWDCYHPPCWNDTLTVARWFARREQHIESIPIHSLSEKQFNRLLSGQALPAEFFSDRAHGGDYLEYRVLSHDESYRTLPGVEAGWIAERIRSTGLGQFCFASQG